MKKIKILFCLSILSVMLFACSDDKEIENFKTNLKAQSDSQNMILEELTDFEWDKVYFIAPYMSKEKIEEIVGCESDNINDNMSDESIFTSKLIKPNHMFSIADEYVSKEYFSKHRSFGKDDFFVDSGYIVLLLQMI